MSRPLKAAKGLMAPAVASLYAPLGRGVGRVENCMRISKALIGFSVLGAAVAVSLVGWHLKPAEIAGPLSPQDKCVSEHHRFVTGDLNFSSVQLQHMWKCYDQGWNDDQSAFVFFLELEEYQCAEKIRMQAEQRGKPLDPYLANLIPKTTPSGSIAC